MKSRKKLSIILLSCYVCLFAVLLLLVNVVDVSNLGLNGSNIGLYHFNKVFTQFSYSKSWDVLSDVFLYFSILLIAGWIVLGVLDLVKKKNILKVNLSILTFGLMTIMMVIVWISFDHFIIINYRPIDVGELEGSFPSTHIMVVTFVMLASTSYIKETYHKKGYTLPCIAISIISISLTFAARIFSSMHWFTDCLGGLLLGGILYEAYELTIALASKKNA